ncbi:unnamed protein product [Sphagnum troendelagicum]|uniref:Uncharacterized protein n=1 Tax=Sphagnum troendelagicum TaxID=128251 RepID=A0ABP0TZM5_9BRYO
MKLLRFVSEFKSHQHRRCWWWLHSPKEWSRCLQTIFGYFGLLSCHQQPISGTSVGGQHALLYLDDLFMTLLFETHNNGHVVCLALYLDDLFMALLFETHNNGHVGLFAMDMTVAVQF